MTNSSHKPRGTRPDHDLRTQEDSGQQWNHLIESAESFLRATAGYSGSDIEAARARVARHLEAHRERPSKGTHRQLRTAARRSANYMRAHPWQGLTVIASLAAVAGGLLAGRHWKDRH